MKKTIALTMIIILFFSTIIVNADIQYELWTESRAKRSSITKFA